MPDRGPASNILRDDLLAQLRSASHPLSTTHLLAHAPYVPVHGTRQRFAPLREQIYRALRALERGGQITRVDAAGRALHWEASPSAADDEIAALQAAFRAPSPHCQHDAAHVQARWNLP